jgi:hypothetical protein
MACKDGMEEWSIHTRCDAMCKHGGSVGADIRSSDACDGLPEWESMKSKDVMLALSSLVILLGTFIVGVGLLIR